MPQWRLPTIFRRAQARFASRSKMAGIRHPPRCCGPQADAASIASGLSIAIEAAMGAAR